MNTRFNWVIYTQGPVIEKAGTIDQIRSYVERHIPMKKGWTGVWAVSTDGKYHLYSVQNNNGKIVNGVRVVKATA